MDDRAAHLLITYGTAVFYTLVSGVLFRLAFAKPRPAKVKSWLIFAGLFLLFYGIGCLDGVRLYRYDRYWEHHPTPWPGASVFRTIDIIVAIAVVLISWAINLVKYWKKPLYQDLDGS